MGTSLTMMTEPELLNARHTTISQIYQGSLTAKSSPDKTMISYQQMQSHFYISHRMRA